MGFRATCACSVGPVCVVVVSFSGAVSFLFTFRRTIHQSFKDTLFILLMLSLMVGVACLTYAIPR
jgi:hypothetical protein